MRITFERVIAKRTVCWNDPTTGKKRQKTQSFEQTVNPFNRDASGKPKDRRAICAEVNRDADLWKLKTENDIRDGIYPDA
ncbi:Uncharacterised protein [Burkholderia pseudomallei]|uniref:hypothetical protein n=1 Tax=Burkholderia pseudomallei TaxID=28450 RepID=UPI0005E03107|nr:hypothetical protein [Burkholderia pseudomallei]MBF3874234.1 hypothetical protein [Burkholderia pseudomallei]MBF3906450.1 hypothetical protein [Burkholderia pseudomallei]MCW0102555.1 hypothetical protein [Burkholderia pseudomallei]MDY7760140.1 hypothetical protein [Burkholderia pseudomallei]MWA18091.1 hypothetical protein [Burkholderia pseudomallei]